MIRSMTGFGRCRDTVEGLDVTVEIRSVNSRFLDLSAKISRDFSHVEDRLKPYVQSKGILRGKVDLNVSVDSLGSGQTALSLDEEAARQYLGVLCELRDKFGLRDDLSVMTVAQNKDLFRVSKPEEDAEGDWARIEPVLGRAVDAFLQSREREGEKLRLDLLEKLGEMRERVCRIEKLTADNVSHYREKLAQRIREALADNQFTPDETRLLTEAAIYADRIAVDEEIVRLRSHFDAMEEMMRGDEAVGRKLDFLVQEMNREINTTGSKCSDAEIAREVVEVKCVLEKIREQIQNLE